MTNEGLENKEPGQNQESGTEATSQTLTPKKIDEYVAEMDKSQKFDESLYSKIPSTWKTKTVYVPELDTMDAEEIDMVKKQNQVKTMTTITPTETIKQPVLNNPQLVKMLNEEGNYGISDEDTIIRKGNQVIIKQAKNNFEPIFLSLSNKGTVISESKIVESTGPEKYEVKQNKFEALKTEENKKEIIELDSYDVLGKTVTAGQVVEQSPNLIVKKFEQTGNKVDIVLVDTHNNNQEMRVPVGAISMIKKLEDIKSFAKTDEDADAYLNETNIQNKILETKKQTAEDKKEFFEKQKTSEQSLADLDAEIAKNEKFLEEISATEENKIAQVQKEKPSVKEVYVKQTVDTVDEATSQIDRGIKAGRKEVINQGIDKLTRYINGLKKQAQGDLLTTEIEEAIASAQTKIDEANKKISEISSIPTQQEVPETIKTVTAAEKNQQIRDLESMISKGKKNGLNVTDVETYLEGVKKWSVSDAEAKEYTNESLAMNTSRNEHGGVEVEWSPVNTELNKQPEMVSEKKLDSLTAKLKTQPEMLKKKYTDTPAQLVADAREAYLKAYADSFEAKGAFKRGVLNLGHATGFMKKDSEKFLNPEAKAAKQKYDELKNNLEQTMVDRFKVQGKTDEQIISIMKRYRQLVTGLDKAEQESEILKNARDKAFTDSKFEKGTKKVLEWMKNNPVVTKGITIGAGALVGVATGGISGVTTFAGFLGARIVRMYVGSTAGAFTAFLGEKIWKSGAGGKYESKLEDLKKKYMAGEITPVKYQQIKEGLEMLENKAKTIKGVTSMGAAFGAASATGGIVNTATAKIESIGGYEPVREIPVSAPIELDLEKYKVDVPADQFITEPHAPGEIVAPAVDHISTPAELVVEKTTPSAVLDTTGQLKQSILNTGIEGSKIEPDLSSTTENTNISTEKVNPTTILENSDQLPTEKLNNFLNAKFNSNLALWDTLKDVNANMFISASESNIEQPYIDIYKDLGEISKTIPPTATESVDAYVQRLIQQGVELNKAK